ncbi:uncharacterized protein PHACADRAFT_78440, partial [Phanerochaete carnosa HHB-10118-sp]
VPSGGEHRSFSAFVRCWEQLPPELHEYIQGCLDISNDKAGASALSLVSEAWCRQFRPHLFAVLKLNSEQECRTLYGIVQSLLSAWLAAHITTLICDVSSLPEFPLWMVLVRLLPACRTVWHRTLNPSGPVSHSAALKSSLRNTTSLILSGCHFLSFRILLRILADVTCSEAVSLNNVTWSGSPPTTVDAASSICSGTFSHVRKVGLSNCTNNAAVPAWLLAAASTRHSFTLRRITGPAVPAETWAIIELIQAFLPKNITIEYSQFSVEEATSGE